MRWHSSPTYLKSLPIKEAKDLKKINKTMLFYCGTLSKSNSAKTLRNFLSKFVSNVRTNVFTCKETQVSFLWSLSIRTLFQLWLNIWSLLSACLSNRSILEVSLSNWKSLAVVLEKWKSLSLVIEPYQYLGSGLEQL